MDDRQQFIKEFVKRGKASGASKEVVAGKLQLAMKDYDARKTRPSTDVAGLIAPGAKMMGQGVGSLLSLISPDQKALQQSQTGVLSMQDQLLAKAKEAQAKGDLDSANRLLSIAQQGSQLVGGQARQTQEQITTGQENLAKGAGSTALDLASFAVPGGKATTGLGRVGKTALTGAGQGALLGASKAVREADYRPESESVKIGGKELLDVLGGAVTGGVLAGGLQIGAEGVKGLAGLVGKGLAGSKKGMVDFYRSTLKDNIADENFYRKYGGEEKIFKDSIKYNIPATKGGVQSELRKYGKEYERLMTSETAKMEKNGISIDIGKAFTNARNEVKKRFSYDDKLAKQADSWFEANAKKYLNQTKAKPVSSNRLRVDLDQKVGDMVTADSFGDDAARKAFATELRQSFKDVASGKVRNAIERYHLLSGLKDAMRKEPIASLPEMLGGMAAGVGTGAFNVGNAALGFLASKAVRSPGLKRAIVTSMAKPRKIDVNALNPKSITPPIISAIQRMIDQTNTKAQQRSYLP